MSIQYFFGSCSASPVDAGFTSLSGGGNIAFNTTESSFQCIIPAAGTLSNFKVSVTVAPGADKGRTFTVRLNGADSALSVTISNTATVSSLDTSEVAVVAGDLVAIEQLSINTPTAAGSVQWTCSFTPTTAEENILIGNTANTTLGTNRYSTPNSALDDSATEFFGQIVMPCAGTLKNLYVKLTAGPGTSKTRTFTVRLNGDNTTCTTTISTAETLGTDLTHTIAVVAGDLVTIYGTNNGTPAAAYGMFSMVFTPTTAGYYFTSLSGGDVLNKSATEYGCLNGATASFDATETEVQSRSPAVAIHAKAMYVNMSADPGTSPDAYSFTLRRNGTTNTALTVTVTADNKTGNIVQDVDLSADDLLSIEVVPLNTPSAAPSVQVSILFGPTEFNDSLILSGASAFTGDTVASFVADTTLSGTASITGSAVAAFVSDTVLGGAASFTGVAAADFVSGTTLSGTGTFVGAATAAFEAASSIAGSSSFAGSSAMATTQAVSLSANANMNAAAQAGFASASSFSATGSFLDDAIQVTAGNPLLLMGLN